MKIKYILIALLLTACTKNTAVENVTETDSLFAQTDSIIIKTNKSGELLDSVTTVTTEKVSKNVNQLTQAITNYQSQLKTANKIKVVQKVIHDTVYIETKKNFWGKTKKTVITKSDSTTNEEQTLDTLQN